MASGEPAGHVGGHWRRTPPRTPTFGAGKCWSVGLAYCLWDQACAAAACRSTRFLELHIGVWNHAAACRSIQCFEFMCLSALLAQETFCLPHVSPVCFYFSCHESVICTNNIQSTVNTKHTTFPIRWENSAEEWECQPGTHARKAALQPPPICVEAPPQPNPTIIVNVPRPEPAEPECSQRRQFSYVE